MRPNRLVPDACLKIAAVLQLENSHGQAILQGIGSFASAHPRMHVFKFSKTGPLTAEFLRSLGVRGVIAKVSSPAEERLLRRLRLPTVNVSGEVATPRLPTVNTDDRLLGVQAARYFQQRGFRHLAYCGNVTHQASHLRREGLRAEAAALGLQVRVHVLPREHEIALEPGRTRRSLGNWLGRLPRPIGLLAFNDLVANEIVASCNLCGLNVPGDVAVLGVGNDRTRLGFSALPVSSVELDTQRIGYRAAEILYRQVRYRAVPPPEELVPPLLIVTRRSTDRFAVSDPAVGRALDQIRKHLSNTIYTGDIARAVGCSARTLALRFRKVLGSSVYAEVQRLRMERARELLANPALTLGEIAYATGHEDARHFSLAFKRHEGEPPGRFRKRLHGAGRGASPVRRRSPVCDSNRECVTFYSRCRGR